MRQAQNLDDIEQIMEDAIACIVLKDEHDQLSKFDKTHVGWDRCAIAGIEWSNSNRRNIEALLKNVLSAAMRFKELAGMGSMLIGGHSIRTFARMKKRGQIVSGKYVRSI